MSIHNNIIPPQNIVINQVPLSHTIMTTVNAHNAIPIATALTHPPAASDHTQPTNDVKPGIVVETIPLASGNLVGVQGMPVQNPTTSNHTSKSSQVQSSVESAQVLTKQRLQDLVREADPTLSLEDEVEEVMLSYVDEFVERVLNGASLIAKNRQVNTIEVKDVQQFLNRNYNMWTPGLGTAELRPYKRSMTTEAHKHRLALIKKTLKKY